MFCKEMLGLVGLWLLVSMPVHAQTDSVQVYLETTGVDNPDLRVEYQGKPFLYAPPGAGSLRVAAVPVDPEWEAFTRLPFRMTTARARGVRRKNVTVPVAFHPPYRYLVIVQDPALKRKWRIRWYWTNKALQKVL